MTEGIIQKTFNRYHKSYYRMNYTNIDYESLMRAIEQELIESIKQEFQYHKPLLSLDKYATLQKRLIGGNNE